MENRTFSVTAQSTSTGTCSRLLLSPWTEHWIEHELWYCDQFKDKVSI